MPDSREVLTRPASPPDLTVTYGPHPDHVIDVRLPQRLPAPLVVMIHGGFWRSAYDRKHTGPLTSALAAAGYVVATPEFRRTGQEGGGWPGTFEDVAAALDAIPGLLAPYTTEPPILLGHSAGGHLAVWAAIRPALSPSEADLPGHPDLSPQAATRPGAKVRAVVSLAGCVDLAMCSRLGLDDGATDLLLGGPPSAVPNRYAFADPARLPAPAVPVTLLHGTTDDRVPIDVSRSYAARTGVPLLELPDTGHFALIDPLTPAWPHVLAALSQR